MKERVNDCIYIRPSVERVEDAIIICDHYPELKTHVVMMSMRNYLVLMHDREHECFICRQVVENTEEQKYVF